jgi:ribosomal protein L11 methylase PrmA
MASIITLLVIGVSFYLILFVFFPLGRGAIYDPSSHHMTELIVDTAEVLPGERAVDLGSGDGRVVIALAKRGAEAHGYEVNPILVLISRRNIRCAGLKGKAFIHWRSFWAADLSSFDIVTVFQVGFIMGRLESKLTRELSPKARIVSHHWRFPTLIHERARGDVFLYRIASRPGADIRGSF